MEFLRRNRLVVLVVAIFVGILVLVVLPWGFKSYVKSKQAKEAQQNTQANLEKLYDDALEDLKDKKYDDAMGKLESLIGLAPNYKSAKIKLREARKKREETPSEMPPSERFAAGVNDNSSDKNGDGGNKGEDYTPPPKRNSPKNISSDATPMSLLPEKLEGYKTIERKWESPSVEAYGRYDPIDSGVKDKIETVFIVVSKFKNNAESEARFDYQKELFPANGESLGLNGHSVNFSLSSESRPDIFPAMATLSWNRVIWFFAIEVIPISTPSTDYKKAIGTEVVARFGY